MTIKSTAKQKIWKIIMEFQDDGAVPYSVTEAKILNLISQTIKSTLKAVELELEPSNPANQYGMGVKIGHNQAVRNQKANHKQELDKLK